MQKLVHTGENHALNINACVKYTSLGTDKEQILGKGKKKLFHIVATDVKAVLGKLLQRHCNRGPRMCSGDAFKYLQHQGS